MHDLGKEQNTTLIIAARDPDLMESANGVLRIRDGRIQETGGRCVNSKSRILFCSGLLFSHPC